MFSILNGREHFYQWDSNQKIVVEDESCNEVHFCNRTDECSLVCPVYEEDGLRVADVPNILLQNDWPLNVYAFCHDYTKISKIFKVLSRTKPADYVYTETEVLNYNTLLDRINEVDENIGQIVEEYLTEHPVEAPVASVNGKTGEVELTAEDVGAATEEYVDKAVEAIELIPGPAGPKGDPFTYDDFTPEQLEALRGPEGPAGKDGSDGKDGEPGVDGKSAYQIAIDNGFVGTETEWLESLKGADGNDGADGKDGAPGADGKDGVSVTHSWDGTTLTITSASGTSSADLKGEDGQDGADGVSPTVTVKTQTDTEYVLSITDKNGSFDTPNLKGQDGSGGTGAEEVEISDTEPTDTNIKLWVDTTAQQPTYATEEYVDTKISEIELTPGPKGDTGADGYTPVKGTDYWTEEDQAAIVADVLAALPAAEGVSV